MMMRLQTIRARISAERIHFLKFILEGYDGLAVLSTLDEKAGLVTLRFPAEVRQEVETLLNDLAPQIGLLPETADMIPPRCAQ
jgi:hypothetical protein